MPEMKGTEFLSKTVPQFPDTIRIIFRNEVLAVLSLQWQSPRLLQEEELTMLHQAAQQVGMALTSAHSHQAVAA